LVGTEIEPGSPRSLGTLTTRPRRWLHLAQYNSLSLSVHKPNFSVALQTRCAHHKTDLTIQCAFQKPSPHNTMHVTDGGLLLSALFCPAVSTCGVL
jgi:hypothetical protein